jgi:hypothetical protein
MRKFSFWVIVCIMVLGSCSKKSVREEQVFQFVVDRISTSYYEGGGHLDTLLTHFDIALDSEQVLAIQQRFIPWGKPPIGKITLQQMKSMKLKDGIHYYLIVNLIRENENRAFNYLVEVFDEGTELWLRKFYMYETVDPVLRNISIKKKKDGAVWLVRHNFGRGEFDGRYLNIEFKARPF